MLYAAREQNRVVEDVDRGDPRRATGSAGTTGTRACTPSAAGYSGACLFTVAASLYPASRRPACS